MGLPRVVARSLVVVGWSLGGYTMKGGNYEAIPQQNHDMSSIKLIQLYYACIHPMLASEWCVLLRELQVHAFLTPCHGMLMLIGDTPVRFPKTHCEAIAGVATPIRAYDDVVMGLTHHPAVICGRTRTNTNEHKRTGTTMQTTLAPWANNDVLLQVGAVANTVNWLSSVLFDHSFYTALSRMTNGLSKLSKPEPEEPFGTAWFRQYQKRLTGRDWDKPLVYRIHDEGEESHTGRDYDGGDDYAEEECIEEEPDDNCNDKENIRPPSEQQLDELQRFMIKIGASKAGVNLRSTVDFLVNGYRISQQRVSRAADSDDQDEDDDDDEGHEEPDYADAIDDEDDDYDPTMRLADFIVDAMIEKQGMTVEGENGEERTKHDFVHMVYGK